MKYLKFITLGIVFGIIMVKSEIISWFRIYEMFLFDSFHMYGIIGSAIVTGIIIHQLFKSKKIKDFNKNEINIADKKRSVARYLIGGIIFGLGWALVGSCPGPMFIILGAGFFNIIIVIIAAILGTFLYGLLRNKLPH